jgi:hypothetical protein
LNNHNAAGSALGYIYQVKWALLELLRGMQTKPDLSLNLEELDDVSWETADGTPEELLQLKHHQAGSGDLTDMSSDIWRTLKVWMDDARFADPDGPLLTIVTTASSPAGSAAHDLGQDVRDEDAAWEKLTVAARNSRSSTTEISRKAWLALDESKQRGIVARIRVIDDSVSILDVDGLVKKFMTIALPLGNEDAYLDQIWAWWFRASIDMLAGRRPAVSGLTFHRVISDLRDKFQPDNLVTTVDASRFDKATLMEAHSGKIFVHQLGWVGLRARLLEKAVLDYHRAITQTTEWLDGKLLDMSELERFKDALIDEWETSFDDMLDRLPATATDAEKTAAGRALYERLRDSTTVQIRERYSDAFYSRGSRYEIADGASHGWHPEFESLVFSLTKEAAQ